MGFGGLRHGKWVLGACHMENVFYRLATRKMGFRLPQRKFFLGLATMKMIFYGLATRKIVFRDSTHGISVLGGSHKENGF